MENLDVKALLLDIKYDISLVEKGMISYKILNNIKKNFIKFLELIKLFLLSQRDTYYGYFLMNLKFEVDFTSDAIAGIRINTFPFVFVSNPLLLCKYKLKEILYIFCHEIDHLLYNHPTEMVKINPNEDPVIYMKFNYAADASVNDRINYEIKKNKLKYLSMPDGIITSKLFEEIFDLKNVLPLENYLYYYNLIKNSDMGMPKSGQQILVDNINNSNEKTEKNDKKGKNGGSSGENSKDEKSLNDDNKNGNSELNGDSSQSEGNGELSSEQNETNGENKEQGGAGVDKSEPLNKEDEGLSINSHKNNDSNDSLDYDKSDLKDGKEDDLGKNEDESYETKETEEAENPFKDVIYNKPGLKINDHNWGEDEEIDPESLFTNIKEYINKTFKLMGSETRGLMPGYFLEMVDRINIPPAIKWQNVLKKYVGTISADYKKTRSRLNRRQPERFDLSGKINDKTLKIVVAIDTSASMSDDDIKYIFNEIFAILSKKKYELTIIECDTQIHNVYKVKSPSQIKMKVHGRGGTSFSPVINFINKEKYYRDSLLIYFTDGFGEDTIPRPKTYRNLWVILGDERDLSLKEPYGSVISMKR